MKIIRSLAVTLALMVFASAFAIAAGYFPNFPIVGGVAYCGGFATGTTGQVCTTTVPAGPSDLAGTERLVVDLSPTTASSAAQTIAVPMARLSGGMPTVFASGTDVGSIAMSPTQGALIVVGTGTVTTGAVTLPVASYNGQSFKLASNVNITTLTVSAPTGYSLTNAPTALTTSNSFPYNYEWIYRQSTNTWHRVQ